MKVRTKRVYDPPSGDDGRRVLVDRLWPRGVRKEQARLHFWARTVAPSTALRQWYGHDRLKWDEFRTRYFEELDRNPDGVQELLETAGDGTVTLLFSSKETTHNNAHALKEYLEQRL